MQGSLASFKNKFNHNLPIMLIVDGVRYKPWTPKDEEKEFHPLVKAESKEIFGKDALYFDVKTMLRTASGIGSIPDAYVIDTSRNKWYVVEIELSTHPVYNHIVPQLNKFIKGIENRDVKSQLLDLLYAEINRDPSLRSFISQKIGDTEVYHYLSKLLLGSNPQIIVVIDEKTIELEEAVENFKVEPDIVEFKTFVKEDDSKTYAYNFEPVYSEDKPSKETTSSKKRDIPEHLQNWEKYIAWVEPTTKELVSEIISQVASMGNVKHRPSGTDYVFSKGISNPRSTFAALLVRKKFIRVRIRVDPNTLKDRNRWVQEKVYFPWFFKGNQERSFDVNDKSQIPYAMELIRQSYDLAK